MWGLICPRAAKRVKPENNEAQVRPLATTCRPQAEFRIDPKAAKAMAAYVVENHERLEIKNRQILVAVNKNTSVIPQQRKPI